uniref:Poly [ADP-ribose] polymerase n=1 Tax=Gouania willdenowi TaxID=441366 RepID=A0A8C5DKP9_GOUWI
KSIIQTKNNTVDAEKAGRKEHRQEAADTVNVGKNIYGMTLFIFAFLEKAKEKLQKQNRLSRSMASLAPESLTNISFKPPPAEFTVISCGPSVIQSLHKDLVQVLQKQIIERKVGVASFLRLNDMEEAAVLAKVKSLGISLELTQRQNAAAGNATKEEDMYVLRGLNKDVLSVLELINQAVQNALSEDLQAKEEATLALTVQWSIKDNDGSWHELSLRDNYSLEEAQLDGQPFVDVLNVAGIKFRVDVGAKTATDVSGQNYEVKRVESETALELPVQWEPMQDQVFKKVELQRSSVEYQNVASGFLKTAKYKIQKIERIQNLYLWHAFSICRQRILSKNGVANLGEYHLYHGTSAESCHCIERDRFDRSHAGKFGTLFGKGVYFAVAADYSARQFSPPDSSGYKRLYVARVLTGYYTKGNSTMSAAPARGPDPADCFDSLVDNVQTPTMYVIFHDDQAYPEYQITFV